MEESKDIVIGSFGYALPHKGLKELVEAFGILKKESKRNYKLLMINAEYPDRQSTELIFNLIELINKLKLSEFITLKTDFLSEIECIEVLSNIDLVVFPYQKTGESSSAAVRMALAAKSRIAVTPLSIFSDV